MAAQVDPVRVRLAFNRLSLLKASVLSTLFAAESLVDDYPTALPHAELARQYLLVADSYLESFKKVRDDDFLQGCLLNAAKCEFQLFVAKELLPQ